MSVPEPETVGVPSARTRRRRRPWLVALIVVVVLAALLVVADFAARSYGESRAAAEIDKSLPSGSTGTVDVTIHGFSVLLQAASGHLDDVSVVSHDLVIAGTPLSATAEAADVPLQEGGSTGRVDAEISVDQKALNSLAFVQKFGTDITLDSGKLTAKKSINALGFDVSLDVTGTAAAAANGTKVALTPQSVKVESSNTPIAGSSALTFLKTLDLSICTAQYLPEGAKLDTVTITPGRAVLDLHTPSLSLSESGLTTTGSCS